MPRQLCLHTYYSIIPIHSPHLYLIHIALHKQLVSLVQLPYGGVITHHHIHVTTSTTIMGTPHSHSYTYLTPFKCWRDFLDKHDRNTHMHLISQTKRVPLQWFFHVISTFFCSSEHSLHITYDKLMRLKHVFCICSGISLYRLHRQSAYIVRYCIRALYIIIT